MSVRIYGQLRIFFRQFLFINHVAINRWNLIVSSALNCSFFFVVVVVAFLYIIMSEITNSYEKFLKKKHTLSLVKYYNRQEIRFYNYDAQIVNSLKSC